jgi:hypothetical protein
MARQARPKHANHGIMKDNSGQEQPTDQKRAQAAHRSDPKNSASREATRDPELNDAGKTPGSGMAPDDSGEAPSG